jgi:hypothetical protein
VFRPLSSPRLFSGLPVACCIVRSPARLRFEGAENDRGLPADRTLAAHLLVEAVEAEPEALCGVRVGDPEALDAPPQVVAGNSDNIWFGLHACADDVPGTKDRLGFMLPRPRGHVIPEIDI